MGAFVCMYVYVCVCVCVRVRVAVLSVPIQGPELSCLYVFSHGSFL